MLHTKIRRQNAESDNLSPETLTSFPRKLMAVKFAQRQCITMREGKPPLMLE